MSEEKPKRTRAKRIYRPNENGDINKATFEGLCRIDCTQEEMCAVLGCSLARIKKWCSETYGAKLEALAHHFRNEQNARYRKRQDELAMNSKNPEMLKFLGKVRLGQKDAAPRETGTKQNFFQIVVGKPPAQLDGPPPAPVRKLINCGDAKIIDAVTEPVEPEAEPSPTSASSLMRKARESIGGESAEE